MAQWIKSWVSAETWVAEETLLQSLAWHSVSKDLESCGTGCSYGLDSIPDPASSDAVQVHPFKNKLKI